MTPDQVIDRNHPPAKERPLRNPSTEHKIVQAPVSGLKHSTLEAAADAGSRSTDSPNRKVKQTAGGSSLPAGLATGLRWSGPPLGVVVWPCAVIVGRKRRRRRRSRGTPAMRLVQGRVVYHARDVGSAMPPRRTRKEQASVLCAHDLDFGHIARTADAFVSGRIDPSDADASTFWDEIDYPRCPVSRGQDAGAGSAPPWPPDPCAPSASAEAGT